MQKFIDGISEIFTDANKRRTARADEFLTFHRLLVEKLPTPVTRAFGNLGSVACVKPGGKEATTYGITLTVEDHIWWKKVLIEDGYTFVKGVSAIKADIIHRLAKITEGQGLEPEDRAKLLMLLDDMDADDMDAAR